MGQLQLFDDDLGLDPDWVRFLRACGRDPVEYAAQRSERLRRAQARKGGWFASVTVPACPEGVAVVSI